jgi:hypothetical protein
MEKQITKSSEIDWKPLIEEGINTDGIFSKVLSFDTIANRPNAFLLKFEAGASYPNHIHPARRRNLRSRRRSPLWKRRIKKRRLYVHAIRKYALGVFEKWMCIVV